MRIPRTIFLTAIVVLSSAGALCAEERKLPAPRLSKEVREAVRKRMARHSTEMTNLVWSAVFLDYPRIAESAAAIANQAQLRKDLERDATDLHFTLPTRFFDSLLQLTKTGEALAAAAKKKDGAAVGAHYGKLSETCIQCHVAYLNE